MSEIPIVYMQDHAGPGGAQQSLLGILKNLNRNRYKPYLICGEKGYLTEQAEKLDVEVKIIPFPSWRKFKDRFKRLGFINQLIKAFEGFNAQLVHSNEHWFGPFAAEACSARGIPSVCHVRDAVVIPRKVNQYLFHKQSAIIIISQAVGEHLIQHPSTTNLIETVHNGVDCTRFNYHLNGDSVREEWGVNSQEYLIGCAGKLCERKSQLDIMEACVRLFLKYPHVKLALVGPTDLEYRKILEDFARETDISGKVIFSGPRMDMPQVLSAFDCFVLPSKREGLPRSVLEALAMRKPVIASNIPSTSEIITNHKTGLLYNLGVTSELSEALETYINNPKLAVEMAQNGLDLVAKQFTLEKCQEKIETIYEKFLN